MFVSRLTTIRKSLHDCLAFFDAEHIVLIIKLFGVHEDMEINLKKKKNKKTQLLWGLPHHCGQKVNC